MAIEKLDPNDAQSYRGGVQLDKQNEVIDSLNDLRGRFENFEAVVDNKTGEVTWRFRPDKWPGEN